ncbi:hypothetical protein L7F22_038459 [Adiantum nelumboides]|nr:hypothetical protein [Adiantum nelumboides]
MKTRQQNIPSEYEESEEAERLDSESSEDSEYAPASEENTSEDRDQAHEDSPSSSRGTGATDKISTKRNSSPIKCSVRQSHTGGVSPQPTQTCSK